jgi:DNA (cytosine-5)-methyltransferase 1
MAAITSALKIEMISEVPDESLSAAVDTQKDAFSVVSMFSGCGGMDLGFRGSFSYNGIEHERLNFDIVAAYDNNPKCVETYNLNIVDHAQVLDLGSYDPKDLPAADVVIGGFPCQDFATCGPRRGLQSERGQLYRALINYATHHKPLCIVGENVPGLANIANGEALQTITKEIAEIGYRVAVWSLYAPDYGVPQNRTRLFIIGVRDDLDGFPVKPVTTHDGNYRSIRWAIEDLASISDESIPNQSQYFLASRAKKGNGQGDETSKADEPSYTVRANAKSRVQFHYKLDRRLTVRECARLQTFPDNFVFPFSATTNVMQIGNAVPPMLGHIVAKSIQSWLRGE